MKSLDVMGQISEERIEDNNLLKIGKGLDLKLDKKILMRVRDRFKHELDGETPHISHDSHSEHSDTFTPR